MSQTKVIEGAKMAAVATANMVACTRVLAATINNMQCQVRPMGQRFFSFLGGRDTVRGQEPSNVILKQCINQ